VRFVVTDAVIDAVTDVVRCGLMRSVAVISHTGQNQ